MHLTNPIYNRMALNIHTEKIDSYRAEDRSNSKTKARHALLIYNGRKHGDHTPIEDHCNLKNVTGTEIIEALITKSTTSKKPGEPGRDLDFLTAFQNKNIPGHILERTRKYLHLQQSLIEMCRTTRAKTPAGWKHPTTSTLNLLQEKSSYNKRAMDHMEVYTIKISPDTDCYEVTAFSDRVLSLIKNSQEHIGLPFVSVSTASFHISPEQHANLLKQMAKTPMRGRKTKYLIFDEPGTITPGMDTRKILSKIMMGDGITWHAEM